MGFAEVIKALQTGAYLKAFFSSLRMTFLCKIASPAVLANKSKGPKLADVLINKSRAII